MKSFSLTRTQLKVSKNLLDYLHQASGTYIKLALSNFQPVDTFLQSEKLSKYLSTPLKTQTRQVYSGPRV